MMFIKTKARHHTALRRCRGAACCLQFGNLQEFSISITPVPMCCAARTISTISPGRICSAPGRRRGAHEIFFDPQTHTARGIVIPKFRRGHCAGAARRRGELSITAVDPELCAISPSRTRLIRSPNWNPTWINSMASGLIPAKGGHPPSKFVRVFAEIRSRGLPVVCPCGRGRAAGIHRRSAGHPACHPHRSRYPFNQRPCAGVTPRPRADAADVCPLSNVKLCAVPSMQAHPIKS